MKRFTFSVPVREVHGAQVFAVRAETVEEARELLQKGESEWVMDEIEVVGLDTNNATVIEEDDVTGGDEEDNPFAP